VQEVLVEEGHEVDLEEQEILHQYLHHKEILDLHFQLQELGLIVVVVAAQVPEVLIQLYLKPAVLV
jgi:hypothetical protein